MNIFRCKFRGMIRPNMALGYEDSRRIAERKTVHMVGYLRARRDPQRHLIGLYRKWHLEGMKRMPK